MEEPQAAGVLFLMFALRCIAPLLLTLGIGYLMNRLVDRWDAEEEQVEQVDVPQPAPARSPAIALKTINVPCWILRNCDGVQVNHAIERIELVLHSDPVAQSANVVSQV